ncbi:hypothetical protein PTI98_009488 [Pleurotus ostreatus]|nr:hypothetical protein PTI98_009488 [Pleurotus ostreatus]
MANLPQTPFSFRAGTPGGGYTLWPGVKRRDNDGDSRLDVESRDSFIRVNGALPPTKYHRVAKEIPPKRPRRTRRRNSSPENSNANSTHTPLVPSDLNPPDFASNGNPFLDPGPQLPPPPSDDIDQFLRLRDGNDFMFVDDKPSGTPHDNEVGYNPWGGTRENSPVDYASWGGLSDSMHAYVPSPGQGDEMTVDSAECTEWDGIRGANGGNHQKLPENTSHTLTETDPSIEARLEGAARTGRGSPVNATPQIAPTTNVGEQSSNPPIAPNPPDLRDKEHITAADSGTEGASLLPNGSPSVHLPPGIPQQAREPVCLEDAGRAGHGSPVNLMSQKSLTANVGEHSPTPPIDSNPPHHHDDANPAIGVGSNAEWDGLRRNSSGTPSVQVPPLNPPDHHYDVNRNKSAAMVVDSNAEWGGLNRNPSGTLNVQVPPETMQRVDPPSHPPLDPNPPHHHGDANPAIGVGSNAVWGGLHLNPSGTPSVQVPPLNPPDRHYDVNHNKSAAMVVDSNAEWGGLHRNPSGTHSVPLPPEDAVDATAGWKRVTKQVRFADPGRRGHDSPAVKPSGWKGYTTNVWSQLSTFPPDSNPLNEHRTNMVVDSDTGRGGLQPHGGLPTPPSTKSIPPTTERGGLPPRAQQLTSGRSHQRRRNVEVEEVSDSDDGNLHRGRRDNRAANLDMQWDGLRGSYDGLSTPENGRVSGIHHRRVTKNTPVEDARDSDNGSDMSLEDSQRRTTPRSETAANDLDYVYHRLMQTPDTPATYQDLGRVIALTKQLPTPSPSPRRRGQRQSGPKGGHSDQGNDSDEEDLCFDPRRKSSFLNRLHDDMRDYCDITLLNLAERPIAVPTPRQIDDFANNKQDGPRLEAFCLDLDTTRWRSSLWNKAASVLVAEEFIKEDEYECKNKKLVRKAFMTHLAQLRNRFLASAHAALPPDEATTLELARAAKKLRQENRRRALRQRRSDAIKKMQFKLPAGEQLEKLTLFEGIIQRMSHEAMSGDESDNDMGVYAVKIPPWRSKDPKVTKWFSTLDGLYLSTRFTTADKPKSGPFPHKRVRTARARVDHEASPPKGLPRNFYDEGYLLTLDEQEREQLVIRNEVDLRFPPNLE